MPQTRPCDVTPKGDQDKYSIALQDNSGRWYGLDVLLNQIFPRTNDAPIPLQRVGINSFHAGRGYDRFLPEQYGYFDGKNGWSTTPGKYHATPLIRWGRGLRSGEEHNMPNANGVQFVRLVGATRYLDVSFAASASYTAGKLILIIRRKVPAGATGVPGTLTAEICDDSSGDPGSVLETATVTSSNITDVVSEYYAWTISEALTSGITYHLKVYGASTDKDEACWEIGCDSGTAGKKASVDGTYTATTYSPYYRIHPADALRDLRPFIFDGALYLIGIWDNKTTTSNLYINGVRGRAVGTQSSTTLKDTGNGSYGGTAWTTDRFAGAYVRIIRGTGMGQVRLIASNDADTLTVSTAWDTTPVTADSEYIVYATDWFVEIGTTGLGSVTGDPEISNGFVYFPQGDTTVIRKMQMDYTDADDHAWGSESAANNNRAYFLTNGYDSNDGPTMWRANQAVTAGTPAAKKISVAYAPTAPAGAPLAFASDMTFKDSILTGDNTNRITGLLFQENALHVFKEDSLFIVQNKKAIQIKIGNERGPNINNGKAFVVAADKQLYIGFQNDVYLITGGGAYPTQLKRNLPSNRSGFCSQLAAGEGWVFAAYDAGTSRYSSLMKYSLDTQTWSEQFRGFHTGFRIRSVIWQDCPETRPRLWAGMNGEMVFQEFPINGVRPYDDSGMKYQHETVLELPTVDLLNTDPKYYAVMTCTTQGLAQDSDTEVGHELVVEYQTDNDVGSANWTHAGTILKSPSGSVVIGEGSTRMLRPRLRLISSEASDPVIVETIGLTLFSRSRLSHEYTMFFHLADDDDEQNSIELVQWLRKASQTSEAMTLYSRFILYHDKQVTLADEPRYRINEVDTEESEIEGDFTMTLYEVS